MSQLFFKIINRYCHLNLIGLRSKLLARNEYTFKNTSFAVIVVNQWKRLRNTKVMAFATFAITCPLTVNAWGTKDPKAEERLILQTADQLFDESKFEELYALLRSQALWYDKPQILWRIARCQYHINKSHPKQGLLEEAYEHVLKALEVDDECGASHKWAAILLDAVSTLKGTKARIEQLLQVRQHMEKAVLYSPNDPTARYLLGEWHYSCTQVSWVERKIAAVIYGSLPDASLELGLKELEAAEEIEQDFYSKNKVLIAKTLIALNRDLPRVKTLLIEVLTKYKNSQKWDDIEAVKEAREAIRKLGIKIDDSLFV